MGADAVSARAALSTAVGDASPAVQVAAAEAWAATFGKGDDATDGLLLALKDDRELIRVAAAGRLSVVGTKHAARIIPPLTALLEDKQASVRAKAANSIGLLAENAPEQAAKAVGPLARLLDPSQDKDAWEQRFDATRSLLRIGAPARSALPAITAALQSNQSIPFLRDRLIPLLPRIVDDARELLPLLTTLAHDKDVEVSKAATTLKADIESAQTQPATRPATP